MSPDQRPAAGPAAGPAGAPESPAGAPESPAGAPESPAGAPESPAGAPESPAAAPEGLAVIDKPPGWTSHDVVARVRRLAGTRRVGHAGTLDPMATGVLLVGIGRATRLLGYLAAGRKAYRATARLGRTTTTDDAEGEPLASHPVPDLGPAELAPALAGLTGELLQRPPAYSAVKVAGRRSYARARAGEAVDLPPRRVSVHSLRLGGTRRVGDCLDVDLEVECSAGTYVRALARDLGEALGVGAHLVALRRTRVGRFDLSRARTLEQPLRPLPLADVVREVFGALPLDAEGTRRLGHGRTVEVGPPAAAPAPRVSGAFSAEGELVALVEIVGEAARPLVVFAPGGTL